MIKFDMSKYREAFRVEASELFDNIEELLLSIEKNESISQSEIQELFRFFHTLKGGGSSVGYTYFSKFVHEFETFLDKMRSSEILFEPSMSSLFIEYYDTSKELFSMEIEGKINKEIYIETTQDLIYKVRTIIEEHQKPIQNSSPALTQNFGFFDEKYKDIKALFKKKEESVAERKSLSFGFFDDRYKQPKTEAKKVDTQTPKPKPPEEIVPKNEEKPISKKSEPKEELIRSKELSSSTIRVDLSKIDSLMDNMGELVIAMSMLSQYALEVNDEKIKNGFFERIALVDRQIRELQESVMSTRMVPMENIYSKFPKQIRDIGKKLGKEIELKTFGDSVEIDKAMIEGLSDPLMHIIRNACDHGLETTQKRIEVGKNRVGTILLGSEQANGQIIISVKDDGGGIDGESVAKKAIERGIITEEKYDSMSYQEKIELIFEAGLSTAKSVTDISGRGVGMDVVKSNISRLGGSVKIESELGVGSKFIISLPLTLAILDGLNVAIGEETFILPLSSIVESLQPQTHMIRSSKNGDGEILILRDEVLNIIRLHEIFGIEPLYRDLTKGMLIIVRLGMGKIALFVDMFLTQQQVVIKPIEKNFRHIEGIGGATVRGDGSIGLIMDIQGVYNLHKQTKKSLS